MPTALCHNLDYLKRLLEAAIKLHRPANMEEATMLADIRDYMMYLAVDALADKGLAKELVNVYSQLQAWLEKQHAETPVWREDHETIRWYIGFLFALEQLLSLKHEITGLAAEKVSREDFMRSWKRTAKKLELS